MLGNPKNVNSQHFSRKEIRGIGLNDPKIEHKTIKKAVPHSSFFMLRKQSALHVSRRMDFD